jgi:hypothetical protein
MRRRFHIAIILALAVTLAIVIILAVPPSRVNTAQAADWNLTIRIPEWNTVETWTLASTTKTLPEYSSSLLFIILVAKILAVLAMKLIIKKKICQEALSSRLNSCVSPKPKS